MVSFRMLVLISGKCLKPENKAMGKQILKHTKTKTLWGDVEGFVCLFILLKMTSITLDKQRYNFSNTWHCCEAWLWTQTIIL